MTDITSHIIESVRNSQNGVGVPSASAASADVDPLRISAQKLEASFLAEMLRYTGVAKMPESFNGGPGEAAFSDFLLHEYADSISRTRSIGLADQIYRSLSERIEP